MPKTKQADTEAETPIATKRRPALKRKGALEVMIAVGVPKKGEPAGPGATLSSALKERLGAAKKSTGKPSEDEQAPEDVAEDKAEYGQMCECPKCGNRFRMGQSDGESEDESDNEMESED